MPRRYDLAEIEAMLPPEPAATSGNGNGAGPFHMPDAPVAEGAGRNTTLYRLVRSLRARGVSGEAIVAAAQAENTRFRPPLPDSEVATLLQHALSQDDRDDFTPSGEAIVVSGDVPVIAALAWDALLASNQPPRLFRRGVVVRLEPDDDDGALLLQPLTPDRLRHELARAAVFHRIERKRDGSTERKIVPPPVIIVADMLARPDPPLPVLARIVTTPIVTRAGELVMAPGYDPGSRVLYAPAVGFEVPEVPRAPTIEQIIEARACLDEVFEDFPFVADVDRTHVAALLFTIIARDLIDGPTPMFTVTKPAPGTGASLLLDAASAITLGAVANKSTLPTEEEEIRKSVIATLLRGRAVSVLDNLSGIIDSATLSAVLTSTSFTARLLGSSEERTIPATTVWCATGNNAGFSKEIFRRTAMIHLDANVERPELRQRRGLISFRHPNLLAWIAEQRGPLVHALLTVVMGWVAAGRPRGAVTKGSYEQWAAVVGGMLDVAHYPGFLSNELDVDPATDVETSEVKRLLKKWWADHQETPKTPAHLYFIAKEGDVAVELAGKDDHARRIAFGRWLVKHADQVFDLAPDLTVRIMRDAGATTHRPMWWLRRLRRRTAVPVEEADA
jgi:putative DNA primase/helicase